MARIAQLLVRSLVEPVNDGMPAYLSSAANNAWVSVPNSAGTGGANVDSYCGGAYRASTGEVIIGLAGGHPSGDNRVVSFPLRVDSPTGWVERRPSTSAGNTDAAYHPDGSPNACHTYQLSGWVPLLNRVMWFGQPAVGPGAQYYAHVNGFNPANNQFDEAGHYPDCPSDGALVDGNGDVWGASGEWKWTAATQTYSSTIPAPNGDDLTKKVRFPWAHDTLRDQLFGLSYADGQGFGNFWGWSIRAVKMSRTLPTTQIEVTFNASSALTQLIADAPEYAAMVYDAKNDRFLFSENYGSQRIYAITPNAGNVWDVGILSLDPSSEALPAAPGTKGNNFSGMNNRLWFDDAGILYCLPRASASIYAMKV